MLLSNPSDANWCTGKIRTLAADERGSTAGKSVHHVAPRAGSVGWQSCCEGTIITLYGPDMHELV